MDKHYKLYLLLGYASILSVLIPFAIALYRYKYLGPALRFIFYFICASVISEACMLFAHLAHKNNLFIPRTYSLIEFTLISFFFIKAIPPSKMSLFIKIIIPVFFVVAGGDLYINGLEK